MELGVRIGPETRSVRVAIFALPVAALTIGTAGAVADARIALATSAFILGWTQLAGL